MNYRPIIKMQKYKTLENNIGENLDDGHDILDIIPKTRAFQVAPVVKNLPANAEDMGNVRDMGSIPGSGGSPGEGNDNPLQYSCLENPTCRGAWQATVHWVAKSQTQLKQLTMYTHTKDTIHERNNG